MDVERQLPAGPVSRDDLVISTPDLGDVKLGPWVTAVPWETTTSTTATVTLSIAEQHRRELIDTFEAFFSPDSNGVERVKKWNTLQLHGSTYVLREMNRNPGTFDLVCYDQASELLKQQHNARKVSRGSSTEAEFVLARCKEAGVPGYSPGASDRQPIADLAPADLKALHKANATPNQATQLAQRDAQGSGLAALRKAANSGQVKINTIKPTLQQLRNVVIALTVADKFNVTGKARIAMLMAGIAEGQFFTTRANFQTGDATGPWQILHSTGANLHIDITDVAKGAEAFLVGVPVGGKRLTFSGAVGGAAELARKNPHMSAGEIAATIEGGGETPGFYSKWTSEVDAILTLWSPGLDTSLGGSRAGSTDRAYVQRQEYTTSRQEDYWQAFERLAGQVNWRRFAVFNTLVFANDIRLSLLTPYDFSETDDWVDIEPSWKCTAAQKIDELQLTGRLAALIPAGAAIACHDKGPTYGTWLVRRFYRSDLLDETCPVEATFGRAQAPLAEPASTVKVIPGTAPSTQDVGLIKPAPGRTYKLNTTRPDGKQVPPKPYLVEFLKELAGALGQTIYVNTYSNHSQESSTGTGQSEHWTGNAADLYIGAGLDTKLGEQICFNAIALCGESQAHPNKSAIEVIANRAAKQGTKSIGDGWEHFPWVHTETRNGVSAQFTYSVQVIWKAPDGSHHDHVHVGIHPKRPGEALFKF